MNHETITAARATDYREWLTEHEHDVTARTTVIGLRAGRKFAGILIDHYGLDIVKVDENDTNVNPWTAESGESHVRMVLDACAHVDDQTDEVVTVSINSAQADAVRFALARFCGQNDDGWMSAPSQIMKTKMHLRRDDATRLLAMIADVRGRLAQLPVRTNGHPTTIETDDGHLVGVRGLKSMLARVARKTTEAMG